MVRESRLRDDKGQKRHYNCVAGFGENKAGCRMIYGVGTVGFICGFFLGQLILLRILRNVDNRELLSNRGLHWKYGLLNWLVAVMTAASAVWLYNTYFLL